MVCTSVDVSSDYHEVESVIKQVIYPVHILWKYSVDVLYWSFHMQAQEKLGPVDMLVNCAGTSLSGKFEDVEVHNFKVSYP